MFKDNFFEPKFWWLGSICGKTAKNLQWKGMFGTTLTFTNFREVQLMPKEAWEAIYEDGWFQVVIQGIRVKLVLYGETGFILISSMQLANEVLSNIWVSRFLWKKSCQNGVVVCFSRVCCAYIWGDEYHSACLKLCFANDFPLNVFKELIFVKETQKWTFLKVFFLSFHGNLMFRVFLLQTLSVFVPQF